MPPHATTDQKGSESKEEDLQLICVEYDKVFKRLMTHGLEMEKREEENKTK
jgi:hypothetical protein